MTAKTIMVQGTMSSAGKSLLVTAMCRIFARHGVHVAPFKAQNMSNNAAVCVDGGEIGRAQYSQALAAGIEPSVLMNPVLLKPESDRHSQVIVNGWVWESLPARHYYERKQILWTHVTTALDTLSRQYDLIIIEGAGSPVELNLRRGDIVNMAVAQYIQAPVLLAGDIDRGGIFAQMLGTLMLLEAGERALVRGLLVNKFRGDPTLFEDGITILEQRGGVPVLGVIPYIHGLAIPEEDAVAIEPQNRNSASVDGIDIAVIAFPHIANFDDFDPLAAESGVHVRYVTNVDELGTPDAIILPGTKSTVADLNWLKDSGLSIRITALAEMGKAIIGICGGYQMLGSRIRDPQHVESTVLETAGLNLLSGETTFLATKVTVQTQAMISAKTGWLTDLSGKIISGYEIHMGQTQNKSSWLTIGKERRASAPIHDGDMNDNGRIWGCYLHGLFANQELRRAWLCSLGWQNNNGETISLDANFNRLADIVEAHLNMNQLEQIINL